MRVDAFRLFVIHKESAPITMTDALFLVLSNRLVGVVKCPKWIDVKLGSVSVFPIDFTFSGTTYL